MAKEDPRSFAIRCKKPEVPRNKAEETEESRMRTIEWDLKKGFPVLPYKMKAYKEWLEKKENEL